jgi:hypothetical protein
MILIRSGVQKTFHNARGYALTILERYRYHVRSIRMPYKTPHRRAKDMMPIDESGTLLNSYQNRLTTFAPEPQL